MSCTQKRLWPWDFPKSLLKPHQKSLPCRSPITTIHVICEATTNTVVTTGRQRRHVEFSVDSAAFWHWYVPRLQFPGFSLHTYLYIGDPEKLRAAGVKPLVDLPGVGLNFQDHYCQYIESTSQRASYSAELDS
jgi:hypothetical protein